MCLQVIPAPLVVIVGIGSRARVICNPVKACSILQLRTHVDVQ